jgi:hypothetical protein
MIVPRNRGSGDDNDQEMEDVGVNPRAPPIAGPRDPNIPLISNRSKTTPVQASNSNAVVPITNTTSTTTGLSDATAVGMGGFAINKIIPHKPDYEPLTETRTVRHTWEGYLSVNSIIPYWVKADNSASNQFSLQMNHIYRPIAGAFVAQTDAGPPALGLSPKMAPGRNPHGTNGNARLNFPRKMVGDGANEDIGVIINNTPTYKNWYEKLYRFWTPISSKYKVTVSFNLRHGAGNGTGSNSSPMDFNSDILIGVWEESYVQSNQSDVKPFELQTVSATTNAIRTVKLGHKNLEKIKGIKWYTIGPMNNTGEKTTNHTVEITGTWKPGQRLGSVRNLTDIKQWYPVGTAPDPMWVEQTTFIFISNDYATLADSATEANWRCVNCAIEMEWLIQYKDLKDKVKYIMEPTHGNQAVHCRYGIDDIQFPYPIQSHRKDPYLPAVPAYSTT